MIGDERHHAIDVLRLTVGAQIEVFDEQGRAATAQLTAIDAQSVYLQLLSPVRDAPGQRIPLTLAVAAPKQKRADWLIEKCAELGVANLQFIKTRRGEVLPSISRIDRWQRKATEAAKQSGALPVMQILPAITLPEVLNELADSDVAVFGATEVEAVDINVWFEKGSIQPTTCFIGPEGGWNATEIEQLSACATPIRFHPNTLRIETAAIAFAAIWQARLHIAS